MEILHKKRLKKIIAYKNGKEIGYIRYLYPDDDSKRRNIEIRYVYVNSKFRHHGVATAMLKFFLEEFKDKVWVSFWTGKKIEKEKGYSLYKNAGFKEVYYQPDYYEDGVGVRMFVKRLKK